MCMRVRPERSEAELKECKERLLALTNRNQHVENCLRGREEELSDANVHISQLEKEYRVTTEQLNGEVSQLQQL